VGIICVLVNPLSDFACVIMSMNSIDRDRRPVWWDMLRTSLQTRQDIVVAHHTLIQVRLWRWTMMVVGARAAVMILTAFHLLVLEPLMEPDLYYQSIYDTLSIGEFILLMPTLIVFAATYIIEPIWRMKAMTALDLWLSARVNSAVMEGLAGFAMMIGVWIAQVIIAGVYFWVLGMSMFDTSSTNAMLVLTFLACAIFAAIIYVFYFSLQSTGLSAAIRHLFRD
jgi:hypothetical protein